MQRAKAAVCPSMSGATAGASVTTTTLLGSNNNSSFFDPFNRHFHLHPNSTNPHQQPFPYSNPLTINGFDSYKSSGDSAGKTLSLAASQQQFALTSTLTNSSFNGFYAPATGPDTIQHQISDLDFPQLGGWSPSFNGGGEYAASRNLMGPVPPSLAHVPSSNQATLQNHHALFNRVADANFQNHRAYANLIREGAATEFRIQNEDFPALPGSGVANVKTPRAQQMNLSAGAQNMKGVEVMHPAAESISSIVLSADKVSRSNKMPQAMNTAAAIAVAEELIDTYDGIRTHPGGLLTNIPASMLDDQFGMAGLLAFLRSLDSDPTIVELALGQDLTSLGLNLNSPNFYTQPTTPDERTLYQTFGPWNTVPCRVQDLDAKVPDEYLTNASIGQKLPNIKLNKVVDTLLQDDSPHCFAIICWIKLADDVLFYLFYNCPGEVYQLASASELFARNWRYHMGEKVWITRSAPNPPQEHTGTYEKSSYAVFDPIQWRRTTREMMLEYKQLEGKPNSVTNPTSVVGTPSSAPSNPMMMMMDEGRK